MSGVLLQHEINRGSFHERRKQGEEYIPATRAVGLNEEKNGRGNQPEAWGQLRGVNPYKDEPTGWKAL